MEITTYANGTAPGLINLQKPADTADVSIAYVLKQLGLSGHVCGYFYLKRCIRIAVDCNDDMYYITKEIYPTVAKEFKTSIASVERCIRTCLSHISCSDEVKMAYIGWVDDRYSNKQIIASVAELIKMNMAANEDNENESCE